MLRVDVTGSRAKALTSTFGIADQEYTALRTTVKRYVEEIQQEHKTGGHAWMLDPHNHRVVLACKEVARRIKREKIQTVVWIGIGGSGLGPKVMQEVCEGPQTVEFLVLDTVDPQALKLYLSILDWKRTFVCVVSKSGNTLESMTVFFLLWDALKKARKKRAAERVVAITDPETGPLRAFCDEQNITTLPIPEDVGGRYSIFTPVGLLPLALLGADIDDFLQGAKDMDKACKQTTLEENPAALLAATQYVLESKRGLSVRVIMPYSQRLQSLGRWNQQLIAESLGKTETHNPLPLAACGPQDQHSLLQQWMEGPRKHWHLFIREATKTKLMVPRDLPPAFAHAAGKSFGDILDACYEGTRRGLTTAKRAHATIDLDELDAYHLGQLFFLFFSEVVLLGKLYRIDPYGQPGVEMGKKIARQLLENE